MRITTYLEEDHARLHELLERARSLATMDLDAFERMRAGLLRHIAIEEKLLFGKVRAISDALSAEEHHALRIEHAALTSLMVPTPDLALLAEIEALLRAHDAREEGPSGVYARCEAALGEGSTALGERARSFPEIRVAQHFDGPGVYRTARAALESARKLAPPKVAKLAS